VSDGRIEKKKLVGRVEDKRLLVSEPEFARILKVCQRDGSTLSPVLRTAWDSPVLEVATKSAPDRATKTLVAVISHITLAELKRTLVETEALNGFANRFDFVMTARSKRLPDGGEVPHDALVTLAEKVEQRVRLAKTFDEQVLRRTPEAAELWARIYHAVPDADGLFGAATSRAEAQMLRLSVAYALLDGSQEIRLEHVVAALAAWLYAQDSARYIFGTASGDPVASRLLDAVIRAGDDGFDFEQQRDLFGRNVGRARLDAALEELEAQGLVVTTQERTNGRPRLVTRYVGTTETTKTQQDPLRAILKGLSSFGSFPSLSNEVNP
jgi:hypothetical protein